MSRILTAVIIDDEPLSRSVIRNLIETFTIGLNVCGEADSAEEGFALIENTNPDIVFLDVEMPRCDGFSFLDRFKKSAFEVIFITGYSQYMLKAIRARALDYLLKPINVDELEKAVERAKEIIGRRNITVSEHEKQEAPKLTIHNGENVRLIPVSEIISIENSGSYCLIRTSSGEQFIQSKTISYFESNTQFGNFFIRIHRGILINIMHIQSYSKGEPCFITLTDNQSYQIARRKKHEILARIKT